MSETVETTTKMGRLSSISVSRHPHGWLDFGGIVDYGGSCQGFGGIVMDNYDDTLDKRVVDDDGARAIGKVMAFCDMDPTKCKGRTVIVHLDGTHWDAKVVGLEWPAFNGFGAGERLMFRDLFPTRPELPATPCPECGDRRWLAISCPDKKPGCLVAHFKACTMCNSKNQGSPFQSPE